MKLDFQHTQAAHCENGVTTSLLRHHGVNQITEPLAFGIGSGLFFIYIPFMKINNGPAIAFRTQPGLIFKRTCKALGIEVERKKFRSRQEAEKILLECLAAGQPVGCQVGVYYLTYFPKEYRFHFNAHNLIVFGKEDDNYLISDPVMEMATSLSSYELERVRFAKGAFAPRGQFYYPKVKHEVTDEQMKKAIKTGIKSNTFADVAHSRTDCRNKWNSFYREKNQDNGVINWDRKKQEVIWPSWCACRKKSEQEVEDFVLFTEHFYRKPMHIFLWMN